MPVIVQDAKRLACRLARPACCNFLRNDEIHLSTVRLYDISDHVIPLISRGKSSAISRMDLASI